MKTIKNGSFVGLERGVCPICGEQHETGTVLLHTQLKNVFPMHGHPDPSCFHICDVCKAMEEKGYVALVGVVNGNDQITPATADRAAEYIWLRRHVAEQIIDTDLSKHPFCYIEPKAIEKIKVIVERHEKAEAANDSGHG